MAGEARGEGCGETKLPAERVADRAHGQRRTAEAGGDGGGGAGADAADADDERRLGPGHGRGGGGEALGSERVEGKPSGIGSGPGRQGQGAEAGEGRGDVRLRARLRIRRGTDGEAGGGQQAGGDGGGQRKRRGLAGTEVVGTGGLRLGIGDALGELAGEDQRGGQPVEVAGAGDLGPGKAAGERVEEGRGRGGARPVAVHPGEQALHPAIDPGAIGQDLGHRGSRQMSAGRPRELRTDAVVVRVEEKRVRRIDGLVARKVRRQQERLEKPGDVGQVPLGRADVGHRLENLVLDGQRPAEPLRRSPDLAIACELSLSVREADLGCRHRHPRYGQTRSYTPDGGRQRAPSGPGSCRAPERMAQDRAQRVPPRPSPVGPISQDAIRPGPIRRAPGLRARVGVRQGATRPALDVALTRSASTSMKVACPAQRWCSAATGAWPPSPSTGSPTRTA